MAKTCTPKIISGQCQNMAYYMFVPFGYVQWILPSGQITNGSGAANLIGPIIEISVAYKNYATNVVKTLKIGDTIPEGRNGSILRIVDKLGTRDIETTFSGQPNMKLIKFDYILYGDNCGDRPEVCKCDPTDETIACPGQTGGICCIAKSKIANWCATLRASPQTY